MKHDRRSLLAPLLSLLLLAAPALSGCAEAPGSASSSGPGPRDAAAPDASVSGASLQEDPFETSAVVPVGKDGKTASVEVPLGPGHESFVVRARFAEPVTGEEPCFQLEAVSDSDGLTWVPPAKTSADWGDYSTTGKQRVSVGHGYGLFAFPNDGSPLPQAATVRFQVALRSCATHLPLDPAFDGAPPSVVRVETLRVPTRAKRAHKTLSLFFAFTAGTQFQAATAAADPALTAARASLTGALAVADIDVAILGYADVPSPGDKLPYSDADAAALDALYARGLTAEQGAGAGYGRSLLVVFSPCLVYTNAQKGTPSEPEGFTAHLPAGLPGAGRADAVFIKAAACQAGAGGDYWFSGDLLGKVLLHETGHALGLYHSVEASGQPDHLDDTDQNNIMYYSPLVAAAQGLSPRQKRAMQSSPLLHE